MSIQAMRQAHNALIGAANCIEYQEVVDEIEQEARKLQKAIEQAEKQEPVAYMDDKGYICNHTTNPERWTPLYTAPPQREWVGLTDEEKSDLIGEVFGNIFKAPQKSLSLARAIEAKLKEKNGG